VILRWLIAPEEAFIGSTIKREPEDEHEGSKTDRQVERGRAGRLRLEKAEIDAMLARLQALSDDHFGVAPDEVTWGDVGFLGHYAELLKHITDSAFDEGEHAA
jgi:hypothetical protein